MECYPPPSLVKKLSLSTQGTVCIILKLYSNVLLNHFLLLFKTETRSDSPSRNSRFSELLGKKGRDEPKKQVPKSLDDFMANISAKSPAASTTSKKGMTEHGNTASVYNSCYSCFIVLEKYLNSTFPFGLVALRFCLPRAHTMPCLFLLSFL